MSVSRGSSLFIIKSQRDHASSGLYYELVPTVTLLTASEYSRLADVIGHKDELIEGERVLAPMPGSRHTVVLDSLEALLRKQFPGKRVVRESGWKLVSSGGVDSVLGPDLMVVEQRDYEDAAKHDRYFDAAPLFVVEVISPSERKARRLHKVGLYLEGGARAVVEVDYPRRSVTVYHPDERLLLNAKEIQHRIESPFCAEFEEIFAGI